MLLFSRLRRRATSLSVAFVLVVASLAPAVLHGTATAAQITSRSIKMSSSAVSAASVTYNVKWTAGTTSTIKSIVVEFCSNSPLIGDTTCSGTVGTTVPNLSASPAVTVNGGITGSWTAGVLNSNRTLTLTKAAGDAMTAGSTVVDFDITTVTNHSTNGTFYARIYTFPNDVGANSAANYTVASPGTYTDSGGVALSLANQLTITAKVQESLTFCIYTSGVNCAGATGTSLSLGDSNGVLANAATTYTGTANFGLASNAQSGVTVRMKGTTLTSGANTITAHGSGTSTTCVADSVSTSVEQFGMRISTAGSGVTAASSPAAYNCGAGNHNFYTDSSTGTASTYGGTIATTAGATDESQSTMEFAAKSATASEAGIYSTALTFVATGVY